MTMVEFLRATFRGCRDWQDLGGGLWRGSLDTPWQGYRYVLTERGAYATALARGEPVPEQEAQARKVLVADIDHQLLPECVVPDCGKKAPELFIAAEDGRLAGRRWTRGEEIRVCPSHAQDILVSQGALGRAQLPEWLRADAKLDPLDALDAETDTLHGREVADQRARTLRVLQPAALAVKGG